jgi:hypothetical protein
MKRMEIYSNRINQTHKGINKLKKRYSTRRNRKKFKIKNGK